jgi:hypothetical protein
VVTIEPLNWSKVSQTEANGNRGLPAETDGAADPIAAAGRIPLAVAVEIAGCDPYRGKPGDVSHLRLESAIRVTAGSHKEAMPRLLDWCDEAPLCTGISRKLRSGPTEVDQRMRANGHASKVRNLSPQHATLSYRNPRVTRGGQIRPAGKQTVA